MQASPIRNLILALVFAGLAGTATAKTVLIDFNNTSGSDAITNPSGGLHYNNANLPSGQSVNGGVLINGGASLAVVDDTSAASGWSLGICKRGAGGVIALEISAAVGSGPLQALNFIRLEETTAAPIPVIASFTVNDHYVAPGSPVTFTWSSSLATTLSISPSIGDVTASSTGGSGSIHVTAPATIGATSYTLTATNAAGSATSTLRLGHGPDRPNILFFLVDDMGWQDTSVPLHYDTAGNAILGTYNIRYKTPAMETLAAQGRKFTNAYACTVCSPSRVSIMTGMNSARHHVTNWTQPVSPGVGEYNNDAPGVSQPPNWRMAGMDATDIPLPKLLQDVGYRTIHVGKAHFGPDSEPSGDPRFIGFDINIGGHGAGGPGSYLGTQNFSGAWRGAPSYWDVPGLEQYHGQDIFLTEALTLEMNQEIEHAVTDGSPFFAYMSHYAVHVPWTNDDRFTAKYPTLSGQELAFATTIEGMDQSLRDIVAKLDVLGVAKDTLVIFYSDNGSDLRDGSESSVLRGFKGTQWEGGMRVPLIVGWAKIDAGNPFQTALNIPQNSREDAIVSPEDMFPTVASIAGVNFSRQVDGYDLSPYFTGIPGEHRPQQFLHHFPHGHGSDHFTVFRVGDWKLIYSYRSGGPIRQLYNLATDIGETNNRAATEPEKLMGMTRNMARGLHRYGAQFSVLNATAEPIPPTTPILPGADLDVADRAKATAAGFERESLEID